MRKLIERVPRQFFVGVMVALAVASYGWIGESDYEQALASKVLYCQMSDSGAWPVRPELNCPVAKIGLAERFVAL